ncbi:MAG: short-chain dehydrogenase [Ponticaulis sp.]|nr:short-chain dehydrogenase [Ponticaulis sp.]|tara:strand:+ start:53750 stop:54466 length:717 start_codon:yes stop_codon:yes gene_type:complete
MRLLPSVQQHGSGARVLVNSESADAFKTTISEIEMLGGEAVALPFDLADGDEVRELARATKSLAPSLDMVVCNAGITGAGIRFGDDCYEDTVSPVFNINLHHCRILCDELLPYMAETSGAAAVLTSRLSGLRGNGNIGVYSLTKAAIAQLARDMAVKFGPRGVRINAISPGLIATGWEANILANPELAARRMQMTPLRRIGQPNEIANLAVFLASDLASFITGQNVAADGGTSITDGS